MQDPNSVGAALRTISLRIRGTSVKELEEMGEETDGVVTSVSKLQSKVMGLSGVNILTDSGAYKDTYTIIKEIAEVWDEMNDMDRAALLELLAGKNRSNTMAAMLTNLEDLEDAYESALGAEGSALQENEKYLESIQGKVDLFTNAVQTMWSNLLDAEIVKFVVDLGTGLVKLADGLGLVGTAAVALGAKAILPKAFESIKSAATIAKGTFDAARGVTSTISSFNGGGLTSFLGGKVQNANISNITHEIGAEIIAQKALNKELATQILLKNGVQAEDIEGALAAMGFTTANTGLAFSFKGLAASIWEATKAFLASPFGTFVAITAGIAIIAGIADIATTSFKEAKEQLAETTEELENTRSEIESLENELKTINDRIDELNSKDKLSLTEAEELKNLKAQNAELKRQIELEKQREEILQRQAVKDAKVLAEKDQRITPYSIPTAGTYAFGGAGSTVPDDAPTTSIDSNIDRAKAADDRLKAEGGLYDQLGELQKKHLEEYDEDVKESYDKQIKELEKQIKTQEGIRQQAIDNLSNSASELAADYSGLEWQYGDPKELEEWQKETNAILKQVYDQQDKAAIESAKIAGDSSAAIAAAFQRVDSQTFSNVKNEAGELVSFAEMIQSTAGITGRTLYEMWATSAPETEDPHGIRAFVQNLIDAGVIADTSAASMQKIVDMSIMIGESTSETAVANKELARSQKRLQYYKLYKELNKYTKAIIKGEKSVEDLTDTEKKNIATIKENMAALAAEISAYDILGDQIEEAKAAFDEFESAKTADSESDRLESAGEMFKAIIDGFHSAELGSETFKAAMAGLVPESVYKDLDTLEEKYDAVWKYMNEDLNKYFTLEYDDDGLLTSVETTTADVERFIQDAKDKGLMSFADGIWTVNETDFSKFAESMGITESALYALAVQMDKIDADWIMGDISTFLESFDMGTESNIYKTITSLADLDQQLIDGKITLSEYTQKYNEYQDALKQESSNALDEVVKYNEASAKVDEYTTKVSEARKELEGLISSGASAVEISQATDRVSKLTSDLGRAIQAKGELTAPSEMLITFAQDTLIAEMESVKTQLLAQGITIPLILESGEVNDKLITKDLETGEYTVAVTPEVQGLSQEGQDLLQSYADLLNAEGSLNVFIEGEEDAQAKLDAIETEAQAITKAIEEIPDPIINTTAAQSNVNTLKSAVDRLKTALESIPKNVTTTVTTINKTINGVEVSNTPKRNSFGLPVYSGTAHAEGSWGLKSAEKNALVGELGTELVVNPQTGKYYTVGDNGAEFVDLPKDAIIFNHRQTEEILKNGHINSRGKAYVSGNAYVGTSGTIFDKYSNPTAFGDRGSGLNDSAVADTLSNIDDDFKELFDWFEILVEEIDEQVSLMEAQLENAVGIDSKKSIYSGLISAEYNRLDKLTQGIELYKKQAEKFLSEIPAKYKDMAKDGAVQITAFKGEVNEKVVEAINNYREWAQKAADLNQQLEETKTHIADLSVEEHNMISEEYERDIKLITNLNDTLEAEMGLLEEKGERSSSNFYEEMIKNSSSQLELLRQQREDLQKDLDNKVKSGNIVKDSPAWHEMVNNIYEVDAAIIETQTSIESFNNSIQELHWENFEKIMDEISAVSDEAEQLRDLIGEDNLTEELIPEQWTADGLTALGLIAQQMENAKFSSEKYAAEIEYLNKEFEAGNYSQDEYNEKLKELKDGQWDAIDAYESAKKAIVDLNKTRVDAIKDGIQKEIDAYEELINKRKEDLNSQKDAHDWAKTVADHTENIDAIQRQIDAMAGDNSAAAIAQRKKLQEQLKEAQKEYDEALYDRSIETQQNSLDKSLETYREEQEGKMEELDAWLENEEQVIAESYEIISANTEAIHSNIEAISDKYGIEIENNVVDPWTAGINALGTYGAELDTATSKYIEMLGAVRQELVDLQLQADDTAASIIETTNAKNKSTQAAEKDPPKPAPKPTPTPTPKPSGGGYGGGYSGGSSVGVGQKVTVTGNPSNWSSNSGGVGVASWVNGSEFVIKEVSGDQVLITTPNAKSGEYTGWIDKKYLTNYYAKGTTGVKSNQLAWVDENGLEEIVMHANNGRLEYLTKGSAVIPNPLVDNIMEWGKVDPKTWLANNRKTTTPTSLTTNNNVIELNVGEIIHVEHMDRDNLPEIQDAIQKQLNNYMKQINGNLKRYTR